MATGVQLRRHSGGEPVQVVRVDLFVGAPADHGRRVHPQLAEV
jgi:hypothetical protein